MRILRSKWLFGAWFTVMCILFFLPGSALPKENDLLALLHIDKLVHIGIFAVFIFLYKCSFYRRSRYDDILILTLAAIYGYTVELIQREWIPGRSFDMYDLAADITGSIAGLLIWYWVFKKNRPL